MHLYVLYVLYLIGAWFGFFVISFNLFWEHFPSVHMLALLKGLEGESSVGTLYITHRHIFVWQSL